MMDTSRWVGVSRTFTLNRRNDRGVALVSVLLLLMLMSALAAALSVNSHTETLIVRNHLSAAQAQAAAEAGLNHAVEAATTYIFANAGNVALTLNALLADPSLLEPDITFGERIPLSGAPNVEYEAWILDEDGVTAVGDEDGDPLTDANQKLIVRAAGYAANASTVLLEAVIAPIPLPAILTDGDLTISGNVTVDGTSGSVHTNEDITISGNPSISGNATAVGEYDVSGNPEIGGAGSGGDADEVEVNPVVASDYEDLADFILTATGQLTQQDGTVLCDAGGNNNACNAYGWQYIGANGWQVGNSLLDGTWYVEADAKISGNPGSAKNPILTTIIATGSIEISGNPDLSPDTEGLLFVTGGDLKISGSLNASFEPGQMLVHEQIAISGNASIAGQLTVEDATSVATLVDTNTISGNPTITYNGDIDSGVFTVTGWREVR